MTMHPLHIASLAFGLAAATVVWWALAYWVARIYAPSIPAKQR